MDFFRAQDDAHRRTRLLVWLFLLSLISLLVISNLILFLLLRSAEAGSAQGVGVAQGVSAPSATDPLFYVGVSIAILVIVLLSSLFKGLSLRKGGEAVANMLDARLLAAASTPAEQRILNVVEEMAIASGMPVPPVYVMEEEAINAFAAGHSVNNAVIGVTRGAINKLSRDELQGVIAHEFSHILHGDMRLNLRLIAWLHGIMVLGIIGHYMIRAGSVPRRDNNNNAAIALFGLGLIVLGASGSFFGGLIKAAVSRQREYLADASAVQYTRNPRGIAGALKRIAADNASPALRNPATVQISHALFTEGVRVRFNSLFATHPPLEKRILALEPDWDPDAQIDADAETDAETQPAAVSSTAAGTASTRPQVSTAGMATVAVALAAARAGTPDDADIAEARHIHRSLPPLCLEAAHSPLGAAAIICLLLMQDQVRHKGSEVFEGLLPAVLSNEVDRLTAAALSIDATQRLALVNICLASLRQLSLQQYRSFRPVLTRLLDADAGADVSRWALYHLIVRHLDQALDFGHPASGRSSRLAQMRSSLEIFLSVLAHCGEVREAEAQAAFLSAADVLAATGLKFRRMAELDLAAFQAATEDLAALATEDKQLLLNAMSACVYHDDQLTASEHELMRMTSEMLDWPLPAALMGSAGTQPTLIS